MKYIKYIENNDIDGINNLIANGWNPAQDNNHPIRYAADIRHVDMVKLLINDPRVDPTSNSNYAIRTASYNGFLEIVKLLLNDPRVDPSDDDNFCIMTSLENSNKEITKLLLVDKRVRDNLTEEVFNDYPFLKVLVRKYKIESLDL